MPVVGSGSLFQAPQTITAVGAEQPSNGGFLFPQTPNIVDFLEFLANSVQIPAAALPASSPWPQYALTQAVALVLLPPALPAAILYVLACYNCATHLLFTICPDQNGQNYFATARGAGTTGFGLIQPSTGLVISTSDQGTSASLAEPKWAPGLTVSQLGFYKTPYGREYLAWNQSYGPTIVALS